MKVKVDSLYSAFPTPKLFSDIELKKNVFIVLTLKKLFKVGLCFLIIRRRYWLARLGLRVK